MYLSLNKLESNGKRKKVGVISSFILGRFSFINNATNFFKCLRIAGFLQSGVLYVNIRHVPRSEHSECSKCQRSWRDLGGRVVLRLWDSYGRFMGWSTLRKLLDPKEHLDWFKIDFGCDWNNYSLRLLMWMEVHIYNVKAKSQAGEGLSANNFRHA